MEPKFNIELFNALGCLHTMTMRFALVKYGGGIVQMSGSMAGNTYARNRYGNYVRTRTKPVNPNTDRQNDVRATLAYLVEYWSETLTGVQRTAWNLYASNVVMNNRLGESIHLSGFNHFIRSNTIRHLHASSIIAAGPVVFTLPDQDATYNTSASEATQLIQHNFDDGMAWSTEASAFFFIFQGVPQNPQRNFFGGPWRYHGVVSGIDPGGAATPHAQAVAFAIAEGQRQWTYARISRADGRLSEIFRADCVVAA